MIVNPLAKIDFSPHQFVIASEIASWLQVMNMVSLNYGQPILSKAVASVLEI